MVKPLPVSQSGSMTGAQVRGARGLLNMSVAELAERTKLSVNTIKRAEAADGVVPLNRANTALLATTLEAEGVRFISADGECGVGVRLELESQSKSPDQRSRRRRRVEAMSAK